MSAANTLSPSNASEVAGEKSESASVAQRSAPSPASRARTQRSAEPTKTDPPPAVGADPAVELACNTTAGHPRSPDAASNAATTTCGVSGLRATAYTWPSETASGVSTWPSRSCDHVTAPSSSEIAATVPSSSPTKAFAPSIVTPLRDSACKGVRQSSVRSPRATATSVEVSPSSSVAAGEGLAAVVEVRITAGWARRRARRAGGVDRAGALEVHEDATTPGHPDRRNREGPARPGDLPLDRAGRDVDPVDGLLAHGHREIAGDDGSRECIAGRGREGPRHPVRRCGSVGEDPRVTRASLEL